MGFWVWSGYIKLMTLTFRLALFFSLSFVPKMYSRESGSGVKNVLCQLRVLTIKPNKTITVRASMKSYPTYRCGTGSKRDVTDYKSLQRNSTAHCARCIWGPLGSHTATVMSCFCIYTPGHTRPETEICINKDDLRIRSQFSILFSLNIHTYFTDVKLIIICFVHLHNSSVPQKCNATIPQLSSKWDPTAGWEQQAW